MTYDEIEEGMEVQILPNHPNRKFRRQGTVKAKEIQTVAGKRKEVIYVDTDQGGRRLCAPSVLERNN